VIDAAVYDSQVFDELLNEQNSGRSIWADAVYRSKGWEQKLRENGDLSRIQRKARKNRKPSSRGQLSSCFRMKSRAREEPVFGHFQVTRGDGWYVRTKGFI